MNKNTSYTIKDFGEVTYEDTIIYYDGPLLYTIRDKNDKRHLVFCADDDKELVCYIVPISDDRYKALLDGSVPLYDAIVTEENVFVHTIGKTTEHGTWVKASALDKESLPKKGVCL